jgi:tetratricopeptide (TPR) repeat protein
MSDVIFDDQFETNPYLLFDGELSPETPKKFLFLLDTIRRESQWREVLGSRVRKDRHGNYATIRAKGNHYSFLPIVALDNQDLAAVSSGKKLAYRPDNVADWVLQFGGSIDDFALIPDDYRHYVEALKFADSGELAKAIDFANEAATVKPAEIVYRDLITELKIRVGDLSGVEEAVVFYENDIDAAVYSGQAYVWLRALANSGQFAQAVELIARIEALLDDLAEGRRSQRLYFQQSREGFMYNKVRFMQRLAAALDVSKTFDLTAVDADREGLRELCRVILKHDTTPKARIVAEKCADALAATSEPGTAKEFYEAALQLAMYEQKPRVIDRIEKRLAML